MPELLDVTSVSVLPDYRLLLEFENGERRLFNMGPYLQKRPFLRLKGSPLFKLARVDYGTVVWPGGLDMAPETLYDRSVPCPEPSTFSPQCLVTSEAIHE
jgi:hypothetical protein